MFLLCAAGLYASVALAPKLLMYLTLKNQYYGTQVRLVSLEQEVSDLHKVVEALENEPDFAAQLARVDFDAARPGDERISVDSNLTLDSRMNDASVAIPVSTLPWYGPFLKVLAQNGKLRTLIMVLSAGLIIVAFTFVHESQADQLRTSAGTVRGGFGWLANRYWKSKNEL